MYSVLRSVNLLSVTRFPGNTRGEGKDMKVKESHKCWTIYSLNSFCMVDQGGSLRDRSGNGTCSIPSRLMPSEG